SRLPAYLEHKRQPRVALLEPESGMIEELELGAEPEFNLTMDSLGKQLVFMDPNKHALVLLEIESGATQIDEQWFSDDAKLFFADDDSAIYVWFKDILYRAIVE